MLQYTRTDWNLYSAHPAEQYVDTFPNDLSACNAQADDPKAEGMKIFKVEPGEQIPQDEAVGNGILASRAAAMFEALQRITSIERSDGAYDKHDMAGTIVIAKKVIDDIKAEYVKTREWSLLKATKRG